ncbi:hypothetical protein HYX14_05715 [Candidatus Woesearchaeota archaeon]|nr:hypothetical protein [Candidatus Woesearchaeota archaeon]
MRKMLGVLVLLVLLSSIFVLAQEETAKECGFWCKAGKFFFSSSEARAGKSWFDRGALAGKATGN